MSWGEADAAATNKSALSTEADVKRYSADGFHLVWIKTTLITHAVHNLIYDVFCAGEVSRGGGGAGEGEEGSQGWREAWGKLPPVEARGKQPN